MLWASDCRSAAASGVAARTWAATWLASRRERTAFAATPPAISTTMAHWASQMTCDWTPVTATGWASAFPAAAADSSATAAPPNATGAFTSRRIRGARSHRHPASTAVPAPVAMVRAKPHWIRPARSPGAECISARLAAQVKHPLARGSNNTAGSSPQTSPATTSPADATSRSRDLSRPTGQVSAAAPSSAGARADPASTIVNSSAGRACATGTPLITMAGPASMSSVPHSMVARCLASAAPAMTAPAAAAVLRASGQGVPPPGVMSG
jgi:hypothetical protein